ncbi:response regulator transcription factor [Rhizobacter fulvus]
MADTMDLPYPFNDLPSRHAKPRIGPIAWRSPQDANDTARGLLLVDDHTIVREGIRCILESPGSRWSITEAESGYKAIECLRQRSFALAVVDLSLPGMPGLELIRRIRTDFPGLPVMVLSMHHEEQYAVRAFKAGATGYLTKDSAATGLVRAVEVVASGGVFLPEGFADRVVQQMCGLAERPRHSALSDREFDVLYRIVAGQRLTDIAAALHLSVATVSNHKARIKEKLQLPNMAALIRYSTLHGLDQYSAEPPAARASERAGADWPERFASISDEIEER